MARSSKGMDKTITLKVRLQGHSMKSVWPPTERELYKLEDGDIVVATIQQVISQKGEVKFIKK